MTFRQVFWLRYLRIGRKYHYSGGTAREFHPASLDSADTIVNYDFFRFKVFRNIIHLKVFLISLFTIEYIADFVNSYFP